MPKGGQGLPKPHGPQAPTGERCKEVQEGDIPTVPCASVLPIFTQPLNQAYRPHCEVLSPASFPFLCRSIICCCSPEVFFQVLLNHEKFTLSSSHSSENKLMVKYAF